MVTATRRIRTLLVVLALAGTSLAAMPACAQSQDADARLKTIEAQLRALQRKVFPDGAGRVFAPEIAAPDASGATAAPATSAVTDILARLDSLEAQLARLTAHTEENANQLSQLEAQLKPFVEEREAKLAAEARAQAEAEQIAAQQRAAAQAAPAPPTPERLAAVQKIAKPKTEDPGDDEYTYGFRLWEAGFYPEAQQQLRLYVDKYPTHPRLSFGRNLLGRAYLADGKYDDAATWLYNNYQKDPQGARAPDSLLYLAEAMIAKKDTKRACIALAEFGETYPALATGRLSQQYQADRGKVTCN